MEKEKGNVKRPYKRVHRCENMLSDVEIYEVYISGEPKISWWRLQINITVQGEFVSATMAEHISYCPYCGKKLSEETN